MSSRGRVRCRVCGRTFKSAKYLSAHWWTKHRPAWRRGL